MVTVTTCNQKEKIQRHMSIVEAKASQYSGENLNDEKMIGEIEKCELNPFKIFFETVHDEIEWISEKEIKEKLSR
jgi:hypothetical protein